MLGPLVLYLKGMRIMVFQLSGFYYKRVRAGVSAAVAFIGSSSGKGAKCYKVQGFQCSSAVLPYFHDTFMHITHLAEKIITYTILGGSLL